MVTTSTSRGYRVRWVRSAKSWLRVLDWGDPAAPTVVCLHGITENAQTWDEVAAALAEHGYRVIAADFRGHGESDDASDPITLTGLAADTHAIVAELGIERHGLIGHSMGGRVAMTYAAAYPETVDWLVIEDAPPSLSGAAARLVEAYLRSFPAEFDSLAQLTRFLRAPMPNASPEALRDRALVCRSPLRGGRLAYKSTITTTDGSPNPDLWDAIAGVQPPTLIVRGYGSKILTATDAERMATVMPQATLVTLHRAAHAVHSEVPTAFNGALNVFLNRL